MAVEAAEHQLAAQKAAVVVLPALAAVAGVVGGNIGSGSPAKSGSRYRSSSSRRISSIQQ